METLRIIFEKIIHAVKVNHLFTKENQIKPTHDDIVEIHTEKNYFKYFSVQKNLKTKILQVNLRRPFFKKLLMDS